MKFRFLLHALLFATVFTALVRAQTATVTPNTTALVPDGGTVTFTATLSYVTTPSAIGVTVKIPSGWAYENGANEPAVKPAAGRTGTLEWACVDVPASPVTFSFRVSYPAGQTRVSIASSVMLRLAGEVTNLTPPVIVLSSGQASQPGQPH